MSLLCFTCHSEHIRFAQYKLREESQGVGSNHLTWIPAYAGMTIALEIASPSDFCQYGLPMTISAQLAIMKPIHLVAR